MTLAPRSSGFVPPHADLLRIQPFHPASESRPSAHQEGDMFAEHAPEVVSFTFTLVWRSVALLRA